MAKKRKSPRIEAEAPLADAILGRERPEGAPASWIFRPPACRQLEGLEEPRPEPFFRRFTRDPVEGRNPVGLGRERLYKRLIAGRMYGRNPAGLAKGCNPAGGSGR